MDVTNNNLKREVKELQKQIKELQSSLTEERVSNLEFDQTQKEQKIQIEQLTDALAKEKLTNQELSQQIQELQFQTDEKTHNFQQYIAQQHQQLIVQNNIINQLRVQQQHQQQQQQQQQMSLIQNEEFDDEHSLDDEQRKELRHRLLDEQMRHEQLKDIHRQSISKLEQYELQQIQNYEANININNDNKLQEEIESLRLQLQDEKKQRENLDKERRNSLAALSQNMFKKLLDSEHQHFDDKSDLEKQCNQMKLIIKHLEKSKQTLLRETSETINDLREHIKLLSNRLQRYEHWQ